ncbi:MAG: uroporphyrinogen decarboxylase family protein [Mobilitalea sp.]
MNKSPLYLERKERIMKSIAFQKTDRTPVVLGIAGFAATATGMPLSEFIDDVDKSATAIIEAFEMTGADSVDHPSFCASSLSVLWLSRVKIPGVQLATNELWQVEENELMTREDYDRIISDGWPAFISGFMEERIGGGVMEKFGKLVGGTGRHLEQWAAHDAFSTDVGVITTPYEMFCGGRSMVKFVRDLFQIPDKVQAAMDIAMPYMSAPAIQMAKEVGGMGLWVGGWRSASMFLSQKLWDRFVYPYYEKMVNDVADAGLVPILHLDSDWSRDLARFKSLPKQKCILATDGSTDLFNARQILGDHICLMGDVPAAMLSIGTPDEVYKYSRKLIDELGPTGFILHSGCDVPVDAKLENVKAMVAAASGN